MKKIRKSGSLTQRCISLLCLPSLVMGWAPTPNTDRDIGEDDDEVYQLSPFSVDASGALGYGATVGGAQDINYARSEAMLGRIPHPNTFTPEGLFSEHDLPLLFDAVPGRLLSVGGEAMEANIFNVPDARVLAQIGFASSLDHDTWEREPLNLVAVVDKSGSMTGQPLELVRQSLSEVVKQMYEADQISIVLYGNTTHVHLPPTSVSKENKVQIIESIWNITSAGSTYMEAGLKLGYQLAEQSAEDFEGQTRLMLFTDERPNVGDTSEKGFMALMRKGSKKGIGLTTIGVGVHFGTELANKISSVRGGNLFFFPDYLTMAEKFKDEFSTMVTELAYDMRLVISPSEAWKISGVYGVPANMLSWIDKRSISLNVETLFLSLRKGGMFFTLAPDSKSQLPFSGFQSGDAVAKVDLRYTAADTHNPIHQTIEYTISNRNSVGEGLRRGELLIGEFVGLRKAMTDHFQSNDQDSAYRTIAELFQLLQNSEDPNLEPEIKLVSGLKKTFSALSGRGFEDEDHSKRYPISGIWNIHSDENQTIATDMILKLSGDRYVEIFSLDENGFVDEHKVAVAKKRFSKFRGGKIHLFTEKEFRVWKSKNNFIPSTMEVSPYLSNIDYLSYKISGDRMEMKVHHSNGKPTIEVALWRSMEEEEDTDVNRYDHVKVDSFSGLPPKHPL